MEGKSFMSLAGAVAIAMACGAGFGPAVSARRDFGAAPPRVHVPANRGRTIKRERKPESGLKAMKRAKVRLR